MFTGLSAFPLTPLTEKGIDEKSFVRLMDRLVAVAGTLTRWTQLFPNITRVIGIATLVVFGIIAAMSLLTLTVGMSKMVWLGMVTVWKVLTMAGLRSIAMFLYHYLI